MAKIFYPRQASWFWKDWLNIIDCRVFINTHTYQLEMCAEETLKRRRPVYRKDRKHIHKRESDNRFVLKAILCACVARYASMRASCCRSVFCSDLFGNDDDDDDDDQDDQDDPPLGQHQQDIVHPSFYSSFLRLNHRYLQWKLRSCIHKNFLIVR